MKLKCGVPLFSTGGYTGAGGWTVCTGPAKEINFHKVRRMIQVTISEQQCTSLAGQTLGGESLVKFPLSSCA